MHAIDELAVFASEHPEGKLSDKARDACSLLIMDLMSATAAGFSSELAVAARRAAVGIFGEGKSGVWLGGENLSVAGAAMANSAAASALDIDDGHRGAAGHPGAGIIAAVFAVAQAIEASDDRIFDAIAIGYDVALRVATARPSSTVETYASGRWVNYGVAAAAGRLLQLNASEMANALGIAGAEGPIGFPDGGSVYEGSTVKECIPPAVVAGLTGAYRAQAGATGPRDLLDRDDRFRRDILVGRLGDGWWMEDCYLKPYACCRYMHAAIDAIAFLRRPGRPVLSLRIETFREGLSLPNERAPKTLEGGQYSYYFNCALAAIRGVAALQPVNPASLEDAEVLALAAKTELVAHEDFADSFPATTPCRVTMDQGAGPESLTVKSPLGDVANPMSREQIVEKFFRLAAGSVRPDKQHAIVLALNQLTTAGFKPLFDVIGSR
ncbi:MmgE/PrpD family protein [Paraburkholderia sp. J8-2]|uniref:MmgE/PrpD family protein n=1 Tax=Paraburkholderia sp. J8-2 TaxID=2805440 RepID=UPI002AB77CEC|nr:MmgE/PrpD family protein [Paraburkholderia sp. J8-2]